MTIGLCTISNQEASIREILKLAAECGFDGAEIWGKPPHISEQTIERGREIRTIADAVGIEIITYGSYLRAGAADFDRAYPKSLAFAEALGADIIRVWAGDQNYDESSDDQLAAATADLRKLSDDAGSRGIEITVERHRNSLTHETEGADAVIRSVDSDNCGLNWQANIHIHHSADRVYADARTLAPLTNQIHVQAWPEPDPVISADNRSFITDSFYQWDRLFSIFNDVEFRGPVNLEFTTTQSKYEDALRTDYASLRKLLDKTICSG